MKTSKANAWFLIPTMIGAGISLAVGSLPAKAQDSILDKISSGPIAPPPSSDETVLAQGNPPLTEQMVTRYTSVIEWLLEIPFTPQQKTKMRSILINDWKQQKPADIKSDLDVLGMETQLAPLGDREREVIRRKLQPETLKQMQADTNNPDTQWLLGVYDSTHRPIAPGNPPLTRQMSDAFAELVGFMVGEVTGKQININPAFKDAWADRIKQKYSGFTAEQQKVFGQMPEYWATLRLAWDKSSEAERDQVRAQWKQQLQAILPRTPEQIAAQRAMANLTALAKRDRNTLTAAELQQGAADLDTVARELRREGGEQNLAQAAQAEQTAQQFRAAANPPRVASTSAAPSKVPSQVAYARAMAALQARHNTFTMMMNMNTISHVANMNAIANIGNSPYRYTVK